MPKFVDHDQRRAELVRVVWEIISRYGIEGATVRKVAEAAGVSIGGLRHYFDSQRGLLRFAAEAVADSFSSRVAGHLRTGRPGVDRAQRILEEMLPLDADRHVEVDVWLACLMRSRVDGSLSELRTTSWVGTRHMCRLAVADCCGVRPPGRVGDALDDSRLEQRAVRLHVFIDGLTVQAALYGHEQSSEEVSRRLHDELVAVSKTGRSATES